MGRNDSKDGEGKENDGEGKMGEEEGRDGKVGRGWRGEGEGGG